MNKRDYNCLSCVNRAICERNNAIQGQCLESMMKYLKTVKFEKKRVYNIYRNEEKRIKKKIRIILFKNKLEDIKK